MAAILDCRSIHNTLGGAENVLESLLAREGPSQLSSRMHGMASSSCGLGPGIQEILWNMEEE